MPEVKKGEDWIYEIPDHSGKRLASLAQHELLPLLDSRIAIVKDRVRNLANYSYASQICIGGSVRDEIAATVEILNAILSLRARNKEAAERDTCRHVLIKILPEEYFGN